MSARLWSAVAPLALVLAGASVACVHETNDPVSPQPLASTASDSTGFRHHGFRWAGASSLWRLRNLPDSLALSSQQKQQIRSLMQSFRKDHDADFKSMASIAKQAHDARQSGKSEADLQPLHAQADAIRTKLAPAQTQLEHQVRSLLTPGQSSWLAAAEAQKCDKNAATLTDAQRTQIKSLMTTFRQTHKQDLDAVRTAMQQARAARQAGKSSDEIQAAMTSAKPAMDRLRAARSELHTQVTALLTPAQKASGCTPFMMGGQRAWHHRTGSSQGSSSSD